MTWIPVSERLPERTGVYIASYVTRYTVSGGGNTIHIDYRVTPLEFTARRDPWNCLGGGNHGFAYEVLAWQPMPEPFRPEA